MDTLAQTRATEAVLEVLLTFIATFACVAVRTTAHPSRELAEPSLCSLSHLEKAISQRLNVAQCVDSAVSEHGMRIKFNK